MREADNSSECEHLINVLMGDDNGAAGAGAGAAGAAGADSD